MKKIIIIISILIAAIVAYFLKGKSNKSLGQSELIEKSSTNEISRSKRKRAYQNKNLKASSGVQNKTNDALKDMDEERDEAFSSEGVIGEKKLTEEEMEKLDEYYDQVEEEWDKSMKNLFVAEFGMTEDDFNDYLKMREGYEDDRLDAFQDFHEQMVEKYGDNYTFSPSEDMKTFEGKLKQDYQDLLRKKIGDENFKRYLEVQDEFNERIRREQEKDVPPLLIEY